MIMIIILIILCFILYLKRYVELFEKVVYKIISMCVYRRQDVPQRKPKNELSKRQSQRHEMMEMNKREKALFSNDVNSIENKMECKCYSTHVISLPLALIYSLYIVRMRSDIAVSDFPDYVMRMTEEDEHNNSMLSYEYWVFNIIMYYNII